MIEWLKTSILGLILLGAVGSILAVGVLKLSAFLIQRLFKPAFHSTAGRVFVLLRASHYVIEHLRRSDDPRELIVTCMIALGSFLFISTAALAGFLFFAVGIATQHADPDAAIGSEMILSGSLLFFIGTFLSLRLLRIMWAIYEVHMRSVEERATADAADEFRKR
jgi:hypothetical protein